jgi:hypothetical protein
MSFLSSRIESKHLLLIGLSAFLGFLLVFSGPLLLLAAGYNPDFSVGPVVKVSPNLSPFTATCHGGAAGGTLYFNSKVEPMVAGNPANSSNIIGTYQQDRWSNGGDDGNVVGYSTNGGASWTVDWPTFTFCEGGTKANHGNFERSSDPWVSISPDGIAYVSALTFNMSYNSASGVEVSRSTNGGKTWGTPAQLILTNALSDKDSVTADPTNSSYAYVVWDLDGTGAQIYLARTTDGGKTWSAGKEIYGGATINNIVVVLPNGKVLDTFTDDNSGDLAYITSTDHGATWSTTVHTVASQDGIGVSDPRTGEGIRSGTGLASVTVDQKTGYIYAVWEDARFNGEKYEAIAFTMSTDGGKTWSTPIQVNKSPSGVQAFTPAVQVDSNGVVAVTYYDFRNYHSGDKNTPTDLWMVECSSKCTNSSNWTEQHVSGPFNIENAPNAGGLFLGDYAAIGNTGKGFQPFFVQTVKNTKIRTDVFSASATG